MAFHRYSSTIFANTARLPRLHRKIPTISRLKSNWHSFDSHPVIQRHALPDMERQFGEHSHVRHIFLPLTFTTFAQENALQLLGYVLIAVPLTFHHSNGSVFANIIGLPLSRALSPFTTYTAQNHEFQYFAG